MGSWEKGEASRKRAVFLIDGQLRQHESLDVAASSPNGSTLLSES